MIEKTSNASCELDPIPMHMLKRCLSALLPTITGIINSSLTTGSFPNSLKLVHVRPLLKKPKLNSNELKNYKTVSNILYLSKLIEKAVVKILEIRMGDSNLNEKMQSAYRPNHST